MSSLPPDQPAASKPVVLIKSPRDAATWAIVYRRTLREKPHDRWLKVAAVIGACLVHLIFLIGAVLGPAYEVQPAPPEPKGTPLLVHLVENKRQPPPPPPIRGVPPKEHGPTHRGNTSQLAPVTHEPSTAAPVAAVQQPPQPAPKQPPVVAQTQQVASPKPKPVAAPLPPISVPKTAPVAIEQLKITATPPPAVVVKTVPLPQTVPPQFQPEPPRKAQAEGTQAMPPPPSLAVPTQTAQSPLTVTAPQIAVEKPAQQSVPLPSAAQVELAPTPTAPPAPALEPVPLPAQVAPTVNLQPTEIKVQTPIVTHIEPQPVAPVASANEPQLEPVPLTPVAAPAPTVTPAAPTPVPIAAPKLVVPAVSLQPQLSTAPAATPSNAQIVPSESPSDQKASPETAANASNSPPSAPGNEGNASASTAPNATPEGSETGNPGQPNGANQSSPSNGAEHGQPSLSPGASNATGNETAGTPGVPNGYIQLKPHGDTEIMSHNMNLPKYRPTVFDQYWTPKGESSVDTALRHAVEKTTVSHTFNLPQGVRIQCTVMPLLPSALFGCHNPDPPAMPLPQKTYDRLNLPSNNGSIPKSPALASSTSTSAAPVSLDNSAECAAARVSGGPLPPNCASEMVPTVVPAKSLHLPAPASSSWVPASDQFH